MYGGFNFGSASLGGLVDTEVCDVWYDDADGTWYAEVSTEWYTEDNRSFAIEKEC